MKTIISIIMLLASINAFAQDVKGNGCMDGCCAPTDSSYIGRDISPSTLIIFFEGSNKRILKEAKKIGAEVLYTYRMFNAVAIKKPDGWTLEQTKAHFEKMKGVLQVNYDRIYHIASPDPSKGVE